MSARYYAERPADSNGFWHVVDRTKPTIELDDGRVVVGDIASAYGSDAEQVTRRIAAALNLLDRTEARHAAAKIAA